MLGLTRLMTFWLKLSRELVFSHPPLPETKASAGGRASPANPQARDVIDTVMRDRVVTHCCRPLH